MDRRDGIEAALGYVFRRPAWLDEALTHKSFLNEQRLKSGRHNERLELLGDAVLALVVTDYLTERFPQLDEGRLSKLKARLVSAQVLARAAQRLELGRFLKLGRGEEVTQGREKQSVLADAFEAVLAAIYRDGGLDEARAFALRVLDTDLLALERAGATFRRVHALFDAWTHGRRDAAFRDVEREWAPRLAAAADEVLLDVELFARLDAAWTSSERATLSPEQRRLLWRHHDRYCRRGARLDAAGKERLAAINRRLAAALARAVRAARSARASPRSRPRRRGLAWQPSGRSAPPREWGRAAAAACPCAARGSC